MKHLNFKKGNYHILWKFDLLKRYAIFLPLLSVCQIQAKSHVNLELTNKTSVYISHLNQVDRQITGQVTDGKGPLPGVNVNIKGSTVGTVTDMDGNFTLSVKDNNAILVFSYMGFDSKEVALKSQNSLKIVLTETSSNLDEVVVVGYTTKKKGEVTGSISTISSKEIQNTSNNDVAKSLAGKVPGLIVVDRGGYPGATGNTTLLIRGKATLGNNSPLIIIDGIYSTDFSYLSPQDIESMSILKDGAAAIYGARAANGVILITTKRGKSGKTKINLSSTYSLSSFSVKNKFMSSEQYAIYNNEIAERNGTALPYTQDDITKFASGTDPINYPNTNFADLTFAKNSPLRRTSLNISGGTEKINYFVSADNMDQVGLFKSGSLNFKQNQIRSNVDIKIGEDFKLGVDLNARFGVNNQPGVDLAYIYKHIYTNEPTQVGIYPNGLVGWGGENGSNPAIMSTNASGFQKQSDTNLRGRFSYDWDLHKLTKGLSVKGFLGIRKMNNDNKSWYTPWTVNQYVSSTGEYVPTIGFSQQGQESILRESFWKNDQTMVNSTLHYNTKIGEKHAITAFIGAEKTKESSREFYAQRTGFPSKDHPELFAGSDNGQISGGSSSEWGRVNYFGSLSYDYSKKYYVDFTLRRDGSSNFGPGKQFGTFPGIALSWAINKEKFLENISWINSIRLRASSAVMGNDQIAGFQYQTSYNYGGPTNTAQPNYYIFGTNGVRENGYVSANVPNPNITWETAYIKNLGVNFSLFDNRLTADANYFYQKRTDILITKAAAIPDAVGLNLPQQNLGKVDNYGVEFQVGWSDKIGDLSYNIGGNFTQAKNKVVYMAEAADVPDALKREGHSLDSYIVYPTNGIFKDQAQVDSAPAKLAGTVPGEPNYIDSNNDGKIDANDRIRLYSSNVPQIQFGFSGGLNYKGFDFNFLFQGQAKAKTLVFFDQSGAKPEFTYTDRWTPQNTNASYPRAFAQGDKYSGQQNPIDFSLNGGFEGADLYYKDATFVRLKEVELGYTFSKEKIKFADLKFFVRGFNLLTMFSEIHKLGLDPEAAGYNNFRESTYPSLKSVSMGFNVNF
ncbi:TonB-linked SusC/RagA family outer membrane protein [Flavobacterium sp. 28A]|uniref:SusC/RagA family TonB-linked outer membrane protein n=1 Tax=Flavobacterium sp. 28A TaxID=2735895 RepID=UPI00156F4E14|nr:TonB-dependent receptor [Flavobacterium sp. 28A]NRT14955.1 TonB-linked SusC/RagA family outer membrane protein [Flavobacterium sp. 28A]